MYLICTYCLVVTLAVLGIVLSVDVNSACLVPSASPMMSSMGTYKIINMDRVDLGKIKLGKLLFLHNVFINRTLWTLEIVLVIIIDYKDSNQNKDIINVKTH